MAAAFPETLAEVEALLGLLRCVGPACSAPSCPGAFEAEEAGDAAEEEEERLVGGRNCDHVWCVRCSEAVAQTRQCSVCSVAVDPKDLRPHKPLNELGRLGQRLLSGLRGGLVPQPELDQTLPILPPPAKPLPLALTQPGPAPTPVPPPPLFKDPAGEPLTAQTDFLDLAGDDDDDFVTPVPSPASLSKRSSGANSSAKSVPKKTSAPAKHQKQTSEKADTEPRTTRGQKRKSTPTENVEIAAAAEKEPSAQPLRRSSTRKSLSKASSASEPAKQASSSLEEAPTASAPLPSAKENKAPVAAKGKRSRASLPAPVKAAAEPKEGGGERKIRKRRTTSMGGPARLSAGRQGATGRGWGCPDVLKRNRTGETKLHEAVRAAQLPKVREELDKGAWVNTWDHNHTTPLHEAANLGLVEVAEVLLAAGAYTEFPNAYGATPLHEAVLAGQNALALLLFRHGANPRPRDSAGRTPAIRSPDASLSDALSSTEPWTAPDPGSVRLPPWQRQEPPRILCSALSHDERRTVEAFLKEFGLKEDLEWTTGRISHVVAGAEQEDKAKRTMKLLNGVAMGIWAVRIDWCRACLDEGRLVKEADFEVKRLKGQGEDGPRLSRLSHQLGQRGAFWGLRFLFSPGHRFTEPKTEELVGLAELGGGVVVKRAPVETSAQRVWHADERWPGGDLVVVYCPGQARPPPRPALPHQLVSHSWILDSVAAFRLLPPY